MALKTFYSFKEIRKTFSALDLASGIPGWLEIICIWISILNVKVIDKSGPPDSRPTLPVEKLYIYRTVAGQRIDMLGFVWNMDEDFASRLS
ncbi:hypothetical protein WN944_016142 [Citrus x changshan-huyou]|uniref:Uncharacterized protein n=1 Tax=Citrus x changshan-huyou TaxID=2935761 RepID=A0AAP0M8T5_9ROSI